MAIAYTVLALVALQRVIELIHASRNTARLKRAGGVEFGRAHYPFIVLLHASWLLAIAVGIQRDSMLRPLPLAVFALLQAARVWVIVTLGPYWTTRVISVPDAPLVHSGPYRFVRHPNYLVVIGEIAVLPLVFGQPGNALVFSIVNLAIIAWRIHVENAALASRQRVSG